jgi:hypothetical protein
MQGVRGQLKAGAIRYGQPREAHRQHQNHLLLAPLGATYERIEI